MGGLMAGWWRTNRLALPAAIVLIPLTFGALTWNEWNEAYGPSSHPVRIVDDGETVHAAGATWGPARGGELKDVTGLDVPRGAIVLAAGVPVAPDDEGVGCDWPVLIEQGTGRQWEPMRTEIGLDFDPTEPESCSTSDVEPYELILPYVIPEDATGPFWVEIAAGDGYATVMRFPIER
ncbi:MULTISPECIES: hypothetical protein [unclassified Microbacterium]|uniref:hypothetical protein n=1 Tax=unclassified Microbacterium TaxID=2609290 RepID=UPI0012F780BA|nr:hypothetical protein [Microbacterium sp. MAH-37]MVQ43498.1 hypothetical protein [Microbacterium sp. MAH-37]